MKTFLVSYDLVAPGRNYDSLLEHLKSYSGYCHPLESLWFISSSDSYTEIRDAVVRYLDTNDKIIVIDVSGDAAAWINIGDSNSAWLKNNL